MKLSRSTLALLALNVAWLAALSWFLVQRGGGRGAQAQTPVAANLPSFTTKSARATVVTNTVVATNDFRWAQLESEDYRDYVARLRSIGCPEQTIRDIIIADVDKLLAPRMQAASGPRKEISFWQPIEQELWDDPAQKEAIKQQRAVDFEKREVIRELLGVDLVGERLRNQGQDDYYGQRLAFLPEEKRARVRTMLDQFADRERELLEEQLADSPELGSSEELARLKAEKDAAVTQLLTPEEREQYDLWFSDAAARVRDSVYGMEATQEEFLKLYELQRAFDQRHGGMPPAGSDAWHDFHQQARVALGDQRYGEWVRAQDSDYRELVRVASRFKIHTDVIAELYSYKQPIEEQRSLVENDPNLTAQQKQAAFEAIAGETQRAFREALGEKAFRHYLNRTSNPWVRGQSRAAQR
jgi:hypothetical protein